jgi:methylmalonyl-CoA/ethylmalonyl-CoA epimerase
MSRRKKGLIMVIDHIGLVVKSIEEGIHNWEKAFGYRQMTSVVNNSRQKVNVVFLSKKDSLTIKLIEPFDESSPVYRYAKRGGGIHHICFKCDDMSKELVRLSDLGLRTLTKPEPGEAFENENIAFIFANNGLNIELIETEKKAKLLPSSD